MKKSAFGILSILLVAGVSQWFDISGAHAQGRPLLVKPKTEAFQIAPKKKKAPLSVIVENRHERDADGNVIGNIQRVVTVPFFKRKSFNEALDYARRPVEDGFVGLASNILDSDVIHMLGGGGERGDGPPNLPTGCAGQAKVWVIANEITYGTGGPHVPTRIDCQLGLGLREPMWGGIDVLVDPPPLGDPELIELGDGSQELVMYARAAYPDFEDPWFYQDYANNNPNQAVILVNGDDLALRLSEKGASGPFGGQSSIEQILTGYGFLSDGIVQLPANQYLIFFELGTTNQSSSAFDFQDAGLLVEMPCGVGSEIVLRDSIGADNTATNGNFPFWSAKTSSSADSSVVPVSITADQNVQLKTLRVVFSQAGSQSQLDWGLVDHRINFWSDWSSLLSNHYTGNLYSVTLDAPTAGPTPWGMSAFWPSRQTSYTTFVVDYDLEPFGLMLGAGEERWLGVTLNVNSVLAGVVESTEAGSSDKWVWGLVGSASWMNIVDDQSPEAISLHDGRVGVTVIAVSQ